MLAFDVSADPRHFAIWVTSRGTTLDRRSDGWHKMPAAALADPVRTERCRPRRTGLPLRVGGDPGRYPSCRTIVMLTASCLTLFSLEPVPPWVRKRRGPIP